MGFSVLINNFNYGRFVTEAINSVVAQTCAAAEIIVVDDGSTDGSVQILSDLERSNAKLVFIAQDNQGQFAAMRKAMLHANSEWCVFLDADDLWKPDHLQSFQNAIQSCPEIQMCYSGHEETQGPPVFRSKWPQGTIGPCSALVSATTVRIGTITSAIALRADVVKQILRLPEPIAHDWRIRADDVLVYAAAISGAVIHYTAAQTVIYRIHGNNQFATRREDSKEYVTRKNHLINACRNAIGLNPRTHFIMLQDELNAMPHARINAEILRRYRRALRRAEAPVHVKFRAYVQTYFK